MARCRSQRHSSKRPKATTKQLHGSRNLARSLLSTEPSIDSGYTSPELLRLEPDLTPGFSLFPDLPLELRQIIWHLALPGPRAVNIASVGDQEGTQRDGRTTRKWMYGVSTSYAIPSLLQCNQESREIAKKVYAEAFTEQVGHPVYFNFEQDLLFFNDPYAMLSFYGGRAPGFAYGGFYYDMEEIHQKVRYLAVGRCNWLQDLVGHLLRYFLNLDCVTLEESDHHLSLPTDTSFSKVKYFLMAYTTEIADMWGFPHAHLLEDGKPPMEIEFVSKRDMQAKIAGMKSC